MVERDAGNETARGSEPGVKDRAKESAREMKDQASEMKDQATDRAENLAAEAKERGQEMAQEGKERARSQAEQQKDRVGDGLRTVASALRRSGQELPEDQRQYGRMLDVVADRAEDASRYLEERDVESLTREVQSFARDHAPVFLSGAFTAGMLGARFLKSSTPQSSRPQSVPSQRPPSRSSLGARGSYEPREPLSTRERGAADEGDGIGERGLGEPGVGERGVGGPGVGEYELDRGPTTTPEGGNA